MHIADILHHKNEGPAADGSVVQVGPDDTIERVLALLAEHGIGALVVTDPDGAGDAATSQVAGIISERDIVRRLHERGAELLGSAVRDTMTTAVLTCAPTDSVDTVAATMTERRIRHMPVVTDGRLVGIVSIGDVVSSRIRELAQSRDQLEQYITG